MTNLLHENAREFYFPGNTTGILLIHGFTGSPSEMRYLGDYLKEKGFSVLGVRLKGHGTSPKDMKQTSHLDWIQSAEDGYLELAKTCDEIFFVGFSMGGAIALHLAHKYEVKGIVSLSTPVKIHSRQYCITMLNKYMRLKGDGTKKLLKQRDPFIIGYKKTPVKCIFSFLKMVNLMKLDLHKIDKPILIMQSYGDGTVHPGSANFIYKRVASTDKSIIFPHNSGHVITCDNEKEQVFEEVHGFISKRCSYLNNENTPYSEIMEV